MADNKKLIENLFASMQKALFLGDPLKKGEFVAFMAPGQFINLDIVEEPGTDGMAVQAELANVLIDTSFVNNRNDTESSTSKELSGSVDRVYRDVLMHAALPHRNLPENSKAELSSLRSWILANKGIYDRYSNLYENAREAYETERSKQHPNPVLLKRLADAQRAAFRDWETIGQKGLYEKKAARIVYLTAEDPATLWADLGANLDFHHQQSPNKGSYYSTFLVPAVANWDSASWATFEEQINEEDHYEYSKQTSWSGGLSGGWGMWSFGGGTSGSTQYTHKEDTVSGVTLKFDYQRVRIVRPWLTSDVFSYKFWTWRSDFGFQYLSDGGNLGIDPPLRPIGRMPVLPQYFIVVKNVELTAKFSKEVKDDYASQVQSHASVGWGPFSVSGSYSEGTQSHYVHADFDGVTFKIAHPQIIARSGILLPKSPDPIRSLPWQGDQVFPPDKLPAELIDIRKNDYQRVLEEERYEMKRQEILMEYSKRLDQARAESAANIFDTFAEK